MSYIRPAKVDELANYLFDEELVKDWDQAIQIASALTDVFDVVGQFSRPA